MCAFVVIGVVSSCASHVPMKILSAPSNRTADERQLDNIECSNQSHADAPLLFGAGVAIAKHRAGKLYADCMQKKGYAVQRADDDDDGVRPTATPSNNNASPNPSQLSIAYPSGWEPQPLTEEMRKSGVELAARNVTRDAGLRLSSRNISEVTDFEIYTQSRLTAQLSLLKDSTHSQTEEIAVNGHRARRYEVSGEARNGVRYKYNTTLIFGSAQIVVVSAFTTELNYDAQKNDFEILAERISGIQ